MNYDQPNNDTEILNTEDEKLREMCRTLKKVDAPTDFDFKLKARIAHSRAAGVQQRRRFLPALRFALPALAVILVVGLLAYHGGLLTPGKNPTIADGSAAVPPNAALPQNTTVSSFTDPEQTANSNLAVLPANQNLPRASYNTVAVSRREDSQREKKHDPRKDNFKGSTVESLKPGKVLQPKGFEQSSPLPNSQNVEPANPIPARDVLTQNGINADFENGKWTVRSVTPNSLGESSGIKPNDVIEEIDNQPLSGTTVFNKIVNGKTLTVTRNGQKSIIRLRNKQ